MADTKKGSFPTNSRRVAPAAAPAPVALVQRVNVQFYVDGTPVHPAGPGPRRVVLDGVAPDARLYPTVSFAAAPGRGGPLCAFGQFTASDCRHATRRALRLPAGVSVYALDGSVAVTKRAPKRRKPPATSTT